MVVWIGFVHFCEDVPGFGHQEGGGKEVFAVHHKKHFAKVKTPSLNHSPIPDPKRKRNPNPSTSSATIDLGRTVYPTQSAIIRNNNLKNYLLA